MSSPLFTADEVRTLLEVFPSTHVFNDSMQFPLVTSVLIPAASGSGFVNSKFIIAEIGKAVEASPERITISLLAQELDVDPSILLRFLKSDEQIALSFDKQQVLTKRQLQRILHELDQQAAASLVSLEDFAEEQDISLGAIRHLVKGKIDSGSLTPFWKGQSRHDAPDYVYGARYVQSLTSEIQLLVNKARETSKPLHLVPRKLHGNPPLNFVSRIASAALEASEDATSAEGGKKVFKQQDDALVYTPPAYFNMMRDQRLQQLESGELPFCELEWFLKDLGGVYATAEEVLAMLQARMPGKVEIVENYVISVPALENLAADKSLYLEDAGWIDLSTALKTIPEKPRKIMANMLLPRLTTSARGGASVCVADTDEGSIIIKDDLRAELLKLINQIAIEQATAQWEKSDLPDSSYALDTISLITVLQERASYNDRSISPDLPYILFIFTSPQLIQFRVTSDFTNAARNAFLTQIDALTAAADARFNAYWTERVDARVPLHVAALPAIADSRLRAQLQELLETYLLNELLPDTVARAQAKGLVRSKKTRKNTEKLLAKLAEIRTRLGDSPGADVLGAIQELLKKFAGKQGIVADATTSTVEQRKAAHVAELRRSMRQSASSGGGGKKVDAPRLFLLLVVILLARYQDGVVYATGKFAPKLMRVLQGRVGERDYARLEAWKEGVKKGAVGEEDVRGTLAMAEAEGEAEAER